MKKVGVYILQCSNGRYYTGSSDDVDRRLKEHQRGKSKSTKYLLPVEPKAFIKTTSLSEARSLEFMIKKKKDRKHIEKLIRENEWEG